MRQLRLTRRQPTIHSSTPKPKALRPSVVSSTVHVFSVVLTSMLKNRLTNQNPESLTCESTVAPAAIAQGLPVRDSGQTTTPVYEGWYQNADGTLTLSWGYFNRNAKEILDIPLDHVTGCPRPAARVNVVRSPYAR